MTQTNNEREALKNIIDAWECLSEGSYTPSTIQMWLIANMKPAINSARKVIESISQNEHQEASLKVYHGEICYKSHADDQSYGMWCPVGYDTTQMYREGTEFYTSPPKQIPDGWKLIGKVSEMGVVWYKQNPHAHLIGTEFYAVLPTTSLTSETNTEVGE